MSQLRAAAALLNLITIKAELMDINSSTECAVEPKIYNNPWLKILKMAKRKSLHVKV